MKFRPAVQSDIDSVAALYHSVIGEPFCYWSNEYPTREDALRDLSSGNLFVLDDGQICGALSVVEPRELDGLAPFAFTDSAAEIGRIVIAKTHRGCGLARKMLMELFEVLRSRGVRAVHISVACGNAPALSNYSRMGFLVMNTLPLYGGEYHLLEKPL